MAKGEPKKRRSNETLDAATLTAYKLRVYLTAAQKPVLSRWIGTRRWVYNTGLYWLKWQYQRWAAQWKDEQGETRAGAPPAPTVDDFSRQLTGWKGVDPSVRVDGLDESAPANGQRSLTNEAEEGGAFSRCA